MPAPSTVLPQYLGWGSSTHGQQNPSSLAMRTSFTGKLRNQIVVLDPDRLGESQSWVKPADPSRPHEMLSGVWVTRGMAVKGQLCTVQPLVLLRIHPKDENGNPFMLEPGPLFLYPDGMWMHVPPEEGAPICVGTINKDNIIALNPQAAMTMGLLLRIDGPYDWRDNDETDR